MNCHRKEKIRQRNDRGGIVVNAVTNLITTAYGLTYDSDSSILAAEGEIQAVWDIIGQLLAIARSLNQQFNILIVPVYSAAPEQLFPDNAGPTEGTTTSEKNEYAIHINPFAFVPASQESINTITSMRMQIFEITSEYIQNQPAPGSQQIQIPLFFPDSNTIGPQDYDKSNDGPLVSSTVSRDFPNPGSIFTSSIGYSSSFRSIIRFHDQFVTNQKKLITEVVSHIPSYALPDHLVPSYGNDPGGQADDTLPVHPGGKQLGETVKFNNITGYLQKIWNIDILKLNEKNSGPMDSSETPPGTPGPGSAPENRAPLQQTVISGIRMLNNQAGKEVFISRTHDVSETQELITSADTRAWIADIKVPDVLDHAIGSLQNTKSIDRSRQNFEPLPDDEVEKKFPPIIPLNIRDRIGIGGQVSFKTFEFPILTRKMEYDITPDGSAGADVQNLPVIKHPRDPQPVIKSPVPIPATGMYSYVSSLIPTIQNLQTVAQTMQGVPIPNPYAVPMPGVGKGPIKSDGTQKFAQFPSLIIPTIQNLHTAAQTMQGFSILNPYEVPISGGDYGPMKGEGTQKFAQLPFLIIPPVDVLRSGEGTGLSPVTIMQESLAEMFTPLGPAGSEGKIRPQIILPATVQNISNEDAIWNLIQHGAGGHVTIPGPANGMHPSASGQTVNRVTHFNNQFTITVHTQGKSTERDVKDLARKIGNVLSDELKRYGGVM